MMSTRTAAIDRYMGSFDVRSRHEIAVAASAEVTYRSMKDLDVGKSLPVTALVVLRGIPPFLTGKARPSRSITLQTMLDVGFTILDEDAPRAFVMAAVGKFWRPDSGMVRVAADDFRGFDTPGFAKGVVAFTVEDRGPARSLLATETRVVCTDASARRMFSLYWRLIGPFSGSIRRIMLGHVKRAAEGAVRD